MYQATQRLMDAYADGPYQSALLSVYLKDGTQLSLTNADIMEDGLTIDRYTTYNDVVTMGTCVSSELNVRLNNHDGRFDGVNFTGARIYVYIDINNTTSYRVSCGEFIVDGQPRNRSEIEIVALDIMTLLDKPLTVDMYFMPNETPTTYSILGGVVHNVIYNCTGYNSYFTGRPNINYYINTSKLPYADGVLTCRQFVSWAFALMGGYGLPSYSSRNLDCRWYTVWDGNETSDQERYICNASNRYSLDYSNEVIAITGLFYKAHDQSTTLVGYPDYALDFTNNPLVEGVYDYDGTFILEDPSITMGHISNFYDGHILGYVPFSATVRPAPFLWPGDPVELVRTELSGYDESGEPIWIEMHESSTLTHVTYKLNGATYIAAEGQNPEAHQTVPTTGSGTTVGANALIGDLTVTGFASFSGDIAITGTDAMFKVVELTASASGSSSSRNVSLNQAVSPGAGWTPIGIVGAYSSMTTFYIYRAYLNEGNAIIGARYTGDSSSSTSVTLRAYVLCLRTAL